MKKVITIAVLALFTTASLSYQLGRIDQKSETIKRAMISNDIEIIIFGEKQL